MKEEKTSYDIVADEVISYWNYLVNNDLCVDVFYVAHFYQKYEKDNKWEECTEIIECQDGHDVVFQMDFCEGQTQVKDLSIYALYQIGQIINSISNGRGEGNE